MDYRNEVSLSGKVQRDAARHGNGPWKFSLQRGGRPKKNKPGEFWPEEFFDVTCWHDHGEVRAGQIVTVIGTLKQESWNATDGSKRAKVVIVADTVEAEGPKSEPLTPKFPIPERDRRETKVAEQRPITAGDPITDEDVPF